VVTREKTSELSQRGLKEKRTDEGENESAAMFYPNLKGPLRPGRSWRV